MTLRPFRYQPALDGVRAFAVALVLLFHAGFDWLPGGYVGVSVFFTLSGYLITSLVLVEQGSRGRLDVAAFYGRRVRRLLPASLLCLAGVLVMAGLGWFQDVEHLRRDAWGALLQVANWVELAGDRSYADLLAGGVEASPLDHYWSLAIEEQWYWVWPLVMVAVLRLRPHGRVVVTGAGFLVFAVAAPVIAAVWGPDAAYWATPARVAELLAGAALAMVLHRRRRPVAPHVAVLAPAALLAIVVVAATWPSGSGPAYTGWFPVFAIVSMALILGLQADSPLRRALSAPPVVAVGAISYGVYLFHWPIYLLIDERTGLAQVPLFVLRVGVTLAVAAASYVLLERPVRRMAISPAMTGRAAVAGVSIVALVAVVVPLGERLATSSAVGEAGPDRTAALAVATAATTVPAPTLPTPAAPTPPSTVSSVPALPPALTRPVRILVVGDSTAMATGDGLVSWAEDHPELAEVTVVGTPGCGFVRAGSAFPPDEQGLTARCHELLDEDLPQVLAEVVPDVVVAMAALVDKLDRVWDDTEGRLGLVDDRFSGRLRADYSAMTQRFLDAGVPTVLWVVPPIPDLPLQGDLGVLVDPLHQERYRQSLLAVEAAYPVQVGVVDLAAWMDGQQVMPERHDGLHWSRSGARDLAERFLAPVVIAAAVVP